MALGSLRASTAGGSATSVCPTGHELVEAADEDRLSRIVARYGRLDLLCLDELGYVQLDPLGTGPPVSTRRVE